MLIIEFLIIAAAVYGAKMAVENGSRAAAQKMGAFYETQKQKLSEVPVVAKAGEWGPKVASGAATATYGTWLGLRAFFRDWRKNWRAGRDSALERWGVDPGHRDENEVPDLAVSENERRVAGPVEGDPLKEFNENIDEALIDFQGERETPHEPPLSVVHDGPSPYGPSPYDLSPPENRGVLTIPCIGENCVGCRNDFPRGGDGRHVARADLSQPEATDLSQPLVLASKGGTLITPTPEHSTITPGFKRRLDAAHDDIVNASAEDTAAGFAWWLDSMRGCGEPASSEAADKAEETWQGGSAADKQALKEEFMGAYRIKQSRDAWKKARAEQAAAPTPKEEEVPTVIAPGQGTTHTYLTSETPATTPRPSEDHSGYRKVNQVPNVTSDGVTFRALKPQVDDLASYATVEVDQARSQTNAYGDLATKLSSLSDAMQGINAPSLAALVKRAQEAASAADQAQQQVVAAVDALNTSAAAIVEEVDRHVSIADAHAAAEDREVDGRAYS